MKRFDPMALLELLTDHDVDFVVIGGVAAAAHGSPVVTLDLDICYARHEDNLKRLTRALKEVHAQLRGAPDVPFLLDAQSIERGDHFTFSTDLGPLDILGTPSGTKGYEQLAANAIIVDLDGPRVSICSLEDLIRMKETAGRAKDLLMLEHLGALRDEIEERQRSGSGNSEA